MTYPKSRTDSAPLLLVKDEDLALGLVVAADEEALAGGVPAEAGEADAGRHGEAGGVAAAGVLGGEDVGAKGLLVGAGDGVPVAVLALLEGDLQHLVPARRLAVPAAVERDVQVLATRVERVGDGRHVRQEAEPRRLRLGLARRVVREGRVRLRHELRARLQAREGRWAPHREAGRVAVPVLGRRVLGVAN